MGLVDTYRSLYPIEKSNGYTENTEINDMRWNSKFMPKTFRYDGIYTKNLAIYTSQIVANKPFFLTKDQEEIFYEYIKKQNLDKEKLRYRTVSGNKVLAWFPSDHFGVISELSL